MELERIYGIQHGGDRRSEDESRPNNSALKSQDDIASELGISTDTLQNYKRLAQAIPEIQSLVESGTVTKTVALGIMKRLSEDEQKQLVEMLPKEKGNNRIGEPNNSADGHKRRTATSEKVTVEAEKTTKKTKNER